MATRRIYSATIDGRAVKPVLCDHCDCTFVYSIERRGKGSAEVGMLANDDEARQAAAEFAAQRLEESLKFEVDPVPCPRCGRFQEDMVRAMVERRYRWLLKVGLFLGIAGLLVSVLDFFGHRRLSLLAAFFTRRGAFVWLPGAALTGLWWWLTRRFDPNRDAATRAGKVHPRVMEVPREDYRALVERLDRTAVDLD